MSTVASILVAFGLALLAAAFGYHRARVQRDGGATPAFPVTLLVGGLVLLLLGLAWVLRSWNAP